MPLMDHGALTGTEAALNASTHLSENSGQRMMVNSMQVELIRLDNEIMIR